MDTKKRIAIVGGGPGGLASAFFLTEKPGWEQDYEITVYQMGWRLGGKGATGRNAEAGCRIEEHGIHVFCRFYLNTWEMMKKVYAEAGSRQISALPTTDISDAFQASSSTLSVELLESHWVHELKTLPRSDGLPWDWQDKAAPKVSKELAMLGLLQEIADQIINTLRSSEGLLKSVKYKNTAKKLRSLISDKKIGLETKMRRAKAILKGLEGIFMRFEAKTSNTISGKRLKYLSGLAKVDLLSSLLRGLIECEYWSEKFDFDDLDELTFREWLSKDEHFVKLSTLDRSTTNSLANVLFAYPEGDTTRPPNLSASAWVSWTLRTFLGRGEAMYFFKYGTGETVNLPLYKVLKARGVKFEFFHSLESIETRRDDNDDSVSVERLSFVRQATLSSGHSEYNPLMRMEFRSGSAKAGYDVWPSEPDWSQLQHGEEHRREKVDFEAWREEPVHHDLEGATARTLTKGAVGEEGFDYFVWAMPPSMIEEVGDEQLQAIWKNTVDFVPTVATQAAQLWLTKDTSELGWPRNSNDVSSVKPKETGRYLGSSMPNPLNGMVAFDDLIEEEAWPANDKPGGLLYFVSSLQRLPGAFSRSDATQRVEQSASGALRSLGVFLKGARPPVGERTNERSVDYRYLFTGQDHEDLRGEQRLSRQYFRANIRPTEAYAQAAPGSVKGRRYSWDSGLSNGTIAGDGMYTGLNVGSFEGAVTGGRLAAFALNGFGKPEDILGFDFGHPKARIDFKTAVESKVIPLMK